MTIVETTESYSQKISRIASQRIDALNDWCKANKKRFRKGRFELVSSEGKVYSHEDGLYLEHVVIHGKPRAWSISHVKTGGFVMSVSNQKTAKHCAHLLNEILADVEKTATRDHYRAIEFVRDFSKTGLQIGEMKQQWERICKYLEIDEETNQ